MTRWEHVLLATNYLSFILGALVAASSLGMGKDVVSLPTLVILVVAAASYGIVAMTVAGVRASVRALRRAMK